MEQHTVEKRWQALSQEVITGMVEWRLQHPKATLKEIEAALDERMERFAQPLIIRGGVHQLAERNTGRFRPSREKIDAHPEKPVPCPPSTIHHPPSPTPDSLCQTSPSSSAAREAESHRMH